MDRRDFLAGAAVTTLSAAVGAAAQPVHLQSAQPEVRKGRRPNVLLLMSDQHKRSCMGVAGDPVAITPNLDAFARESVRFTNMYCANPVCGPSRASMLTGLFNHHLGHPRGKDYTYAPRYKTMPGRFSQAGYFTGLIGKMHFGDAQLHGFDYELEFNDWFQYLGPKAKLYADEMGAPGSGGGLPQIASLWETGGRLNGPLNDPWKGHREPDGRLGQVAVGRPSVMEEEDHFESFVAEQTVRFLETYAGSGEPGDTPFFLISSFLKPHNPFMPAKRFAEMFRPEEMKLSPTWGEADLSNVPRRVRESIERDHYTPELREAAGARKRTAYYYGNLAQMDDCAGKVLGALKRLGLDENTIVVYTSDHGEMLGDLGLWAKFQFYEGSCGVPFMVRMPGGAPAQCDVPLSLVSLSSTLAELCDVPVDGPSDGKSFATLVRDPKSNFEYGPVFAEFSISNNNAKYMIRDGQWKYTYWVDDVLELYDLSADPKELRNLAGHAECAGKVKELHAKLMAWYTPPPAKGKRETTREEGSAPQVRERFLSVEI